MKMYDVTGQVLGRVSTIIAKDLLKGEKVIVVNCEKSILSGNPKYTTETYARKFKRGDTIHGPFFPRVPDRLFKRTVRGMLNYKKPRGRNALDNLTVFIGIPEKLSGKTFDRAKAKDVSDLKTKYITLEDLSTAIGAKKRW
jgi:large subunit ribosomal protein L13